VIDNHKSLLEEIEKASLPSYWHAGMENTEALALPLLRSLLSCKQRDISVSRENGKSHWCGVPLREEYFKDQDGFNAFTAGVT
jgi:hypothetical protein